MGSRISFLRRWEHAETIQTLSPIIDGPTYNSLTYQITVRLADKQEKQKQTTRNERYKVYKRRTPKIYRNEQSPSSHSTLRNNMSSSPVKTEFTEVLTGSDLLPPRPVSISSEEFPTVITESSLLPLPETSNLPTESENLIDVYDRTFASLDLYRDFTNAKLAPWANTIEYKYFDALYTYHRGMSGTIRNLRQHAARLLDEADSLSRQHYAKCRELEKFTSSLEQTPFQQRLSKPMKVYPRRPPPMTERLVPSVQKPTFPTPSTSTIRPLRPPYPQVASRAPIRCFQCDSPLHIKWYVTSIDAKVARKLPPDTPTRIVRNKEKNTSRSTMEPEGILILKEMTVISAENAENSKNKSTDVFKPNRSIFAASRLFNLYHHPMPTYFETVLNTTVTSIYPYPPPIIIKHHFWYFPDSDFFITIRSIVYGLHQRHFESSSFFSDILNRNEPGHDIPQGMSIHLSNSI